MEFDYRGYRLLLDFTDIWSAKVFAPNSIKPYGVIVRATEAEGKFTVLDRAQKLVDVLIKTPRR